MRTTLNIDDDLYAKALKLTGIEDKTALMNESLKALVERESTRRLVQLGCSDPKLKYIARRHSKLNE